MGHKVLEILTILQQKLQSYDLKPEWLDQSFTGSDGERHRITGLNTRAPKRPIMTESRGSGYKWPADAVARYMSRQA